MTGGSDYHPTPPASERDEPIASAPGQPTRPKSLYQRFKAAAKALKQEVLALYYAIEDRRTPFLAKLLPWFVLAYALSPLDLIPDFIPVLGLLDDLLLLPGLMWLAIKLIPAQVMADARARAIAEPLRLSSNWIVGAVIFFLWMAGVEFSIYLALATWGTPEVLVYQYHIMGAVAALGIVGFVWWLTSEMRKEEERKRRAAHKKAKKHKHRAEAAAAAAVHDLEHGHNQDTEGLHQPLLPSVEESPYSGQDSPANASMQAATQNGS